MVRKHLQRMLPSPDALQAKRSLRWLGPLLRRPWLWHLSRRRVAMGAAVGVFFGFMIPVLQIAFSALLAIALRANLPAAAVATLVSNPLTYAPIFVAAYRTGAAVLGESVDDEQAAVLAGDVDHAEGDARSWPQRIAGIGKPLVVGLGIFAVVGAVLTWFAVNAIWVLAVRVRRRRGARRSRAPPASG
jgi:uncharacterized protein (DUF2062 family)